MEKPRPGGGGCHTPSPSKSPQLPPLESQRAKESRLAHLFGSYLPNFILPELRSNLRLTVILSVGAGGNAGPEDNCGAIPPPSWGREKVPRRLAPSSTLALWLPGLALGMRFQIPTQPRSTHNSGLENSVKSLISEASHGAWHPGMA